MHDPRDPRRRTPLRPLRALDNHPAAAQAPDAAASRSLDARGPHGRANRTVRRYAGALALVSFLAGLEDPEDPVRALDAADALDAANRDDREWTAH